MAAKPRIYTPQDEELEVALETAVEAGLVPAGAAAPKKLRALVRYATDQLIEEKERAERIAAYEKLAQDDERLAVISAWNRAAAEDGLI